MSPRWLAWVAVGGPFVFLALIVALHRLRPEVDALRHDLSLYAVGPYGYLMAAAFLTLGTSVFACALRARRAAAGPSILRVNRSVLAISGVGAALVAAFPTSSMYPETLIDYFEVAASLVFFVGFAGSSTCLSLLALRGTRRTVSAIISGEFTFFFLCMLFGSEDVHGLLMRIAVFWALAWLVIAGRWLAE